MNEKCRKRLLEGKLLPLPKVKDRVPTVKEIRPIFMCTHHDKFLSLCLRQSLKKYIRENVPRFANQYGFQEGISIYAAHNAYDKAIRHLNEEL